MNLSNIRKYFYDLRVPLAVHIISNKMNGSFPSRTDHKPQRQARNSG